MRNDRVFTHAEKTVKKHPPEKACAIARNIVPPHMGICVDALYKRKYASGFY